MVKDHERCSALNRWDQHFYSIAALTAQMSKHPHIKVGCVLVRNRYMLAGGFNGLPRKVNDKRLLDQSQEVSGTVHAEANAIASAALHGVALPGSTAYITYPPCAQCAALLIQVGVTRVVFPNTVVPSKWAPSMDLALDLLREAQVSLMAREVKGRACVTPGKE